MLVFENFRYDQQNRKSLNAKWFEASRNIIQHLQTLFIINELYWNVFSWNIFSFITLFKSWLVQNDLLRDVASISEPKIVIQRYSLIILWLEKKRTFQNMEVVELRWDEFDQ